MSVLNTVVRIILITLACSPPHPFEIIVNEYLSSYIRKQESSTQMTRCPLFVIGKKLTTKQTNSEIYKRLWLWINFLKKENLSSSFPRKLRTAIINTNPFIHNNERGQKPVLLNAYAWSTCLFGVNPALN